MGLSLSLIDQTLYDAFGQRQIATIYSSTNQYKVILEVAPDFQADPSALSGLFIRGPTGAQVPLSAVAHFTPKVEPLSVNHEGQFPAVTLSFNLTPGVALGQAVAKIQAGGHAEDPGDPRRRLPGHAQAFQSSLSSRPSWSRPPSSRSMSCWACSMRASSTPDHSRPCPRRGGRC
jgi:multidrug efflux pump